MNGPYDAQPLGRAGPPQMFDGFGHGANRQTLAGVPHFREVELLRALSGREIWSSATGAFPAACG